MFNSLFGWQNSATYGSVISYNLYWLAVIAAFVLMRHQEKHGRMPFMKELKEADPPAGERADSSSAGSLQGKEGANISTNVRQVSR